MDNIISFIFGPSEEITTHAPIQGVNHTDAVIRVDGDEQAEVEEEEEIYADNMYSTDEDEDDEDGYNASDLAYNSANKETRRRINGIIKETRDLYVEPREMISIVYKAFQREYAHGAESLNTGALEYISSDNYNIATNQQGSFKCLFYETLSLKMDRRTESCRAIDGVDNVFLVNKQLDFVYGRVIEDVILRHNLTLSRRAYEHFLNRRGQLFPCMSDHLQHDKCCPSEWVLYVNVNSPFYTYCSKQLKHETPYVDFGLSLQYVAAEQLSFYLVLLLCGHLLPTLTFEQTSLDTAAATTTTTTTPIHHYMQVNQWKKLPIWFLAVWYAGHPPNSL